MIRFLMTTRTEKVLAAGPGQSVGLLPGSLKEDVRPRWVPRGIHTMDINWKNAVKIHRAAADAIKEILLEN